MSKRDEKTRLPWLMTKWLFTALFLILTALFLFSLVGWISWISPQRVHATGLMYGVFYAGRINPESAATSPNLPESGWTAGFTTYVGVSLNWLPDLETTSRSTSVSLPVWIPALLAGAIAAALWWRQRRATLAFLESVAVLLRPARPVRTRIWMVLVATAGVFSLGLVYARLVEYLHRTGSDAFEIALRLVPWVGGMLFYGCPIFGFLIVWCWVRFRNHLLFASGDVCHKCGYNLTGNVSGICPECGRAVDPAPHKTEPVE